jgi:hypothetical protein
MKYTRYLIYGRPLRPEELGIIAIPSAIMGIAFVMLFLPQAALVDLVRYFILKYRIYQRRQKNLNYVKVVLRSLGHPETDEMIKLLIAA